VTTAKDPLLEAALGLAWSHWVGLGVRGTARPPTTAVDPEALLYLTANVADHDRRLRDEVADWWQKYHGYVSLSRMRGLGPSMGQPIIDKLDHLLETLERTARTSGKARLDHLATPARAWLRMRCVFGVSARVEILLELFAHTAPHDLGLTTLALARTGYSKRNIQLALDDLVLGGVVIATLEGNRKHYRLANSTWLAHVVPPLPAISGRWHFRLPLLALVLELAVRLAGRDAVVQGVEAHKLLERLQPLLAGAGIAPPRLAASAETYWPALQRWLIDHVIADRGASDRGVAHMIEGAWLAPDREPQRLDQVSAAVLPRVSADPATDRELLCLDLVQVPAVGTSDDWLWATLSEAGKATYAHTLGMTRGERWRFATWAFGEPRIYAVEYAEPLAHAQIAALYGKAAAERARSDRPAIQLRLHRLPDAAS